MTPLRFIPVAGVAAIALLSLVAPSSMAVQSSAAARPLLPAKANMVPAKYSGTFTSTPDSPSTWRGTMTWKYDGMEGGNALYLPGSGSVAWTYTPRATCTAQPVAGSVALNADSGVMRLHPVKGGKREYEVLVMLPPEQQPRVTQSCPDPNSDTGGMIESQVTVPVGGEGYVLLSNSVEQQRNSSFFTDAKAKKLVGALDHPPAAAFQNWAWTFKGSGAKNAK